MEEEVTQKTIALAIRTTKLTADVLRRALAKFLEAQKQKGSNPHSKGKQSVKKLVGQNAGVSNIEISEGNIKSFERVAKKYGIDFAVKKDRSVTPPKYLVFFKGRDNDVLNQAFKEFVGKNMKKQQVKTSILARLAKYRDAVAKGMNRERAKEHQKDRGQSL